MSTKGNQGTKPKSKGQPHTINKYHNLLLQGCLSQDIEIVKSECKKQKVELEIKDEYGNTPFIVACGSGNLEIIKILIAKLKSIHFGILDSLFHRVIRSHFTDFTSPTCY